MLSFIFLFAKLYKSTRTSNESQMDMEKDTNNTDGCWKTFTKGRDCILTFWLDDYNDYHRGLRGNEGKYFSEFLRSRDELLNLLEAKLCIINKCVRSGKGLEFATYDDRTKKDLETISKKIEDEVKIVEAAYMASKLFPRYDQKKFEERRQSLLIRFAAESESAYVRIEVSPGVDIKFNHESQIIMQLRKSIKGSFLEHKSLYGMVNY